MHVTRANEARRLDVMEAVRSEHRAICDAIAEHDPAEARSHALEHLANGRRRLELGGLLKPSSDDRQSMRASTKPGNTSLAKQRPQSKRKPV